MANIVEKIIRSKVQSDFNTGDIINIKVDWAMVHDGTIVLTQKHFQEICDKVFDPDKIFVVFDHLYPPNNVNTANLIKAAREFVKQQGITHFYEGGEGICHQVLLESADVKAGDFLVGADSHSSTVGAKYCLAMGVGATDMAYIFAKGETWIKIPKCIKVKLYGKLSCGVTYKDVFLEVAKKITVEGAVYKGLVFESDMPVEFDDRAVLCNMGIELGAKFTIFEPFGDEYPELKSDSNNDFDKLYEFNLNEICGNIACPHDVDQVVKVQDLHKKTIDIAFIGTCTGGRLSDFIKAEQILRGKKVKKGVRLYLCPASRQILIEMVKNGILDSLLNTGAVLLPTGCGPCLGGHLGVLGDNETAISTANRNFLGRMGSSNSEIYLASSITVAQSALTGYVGRNSDE